jgi:hypothetical protein
MDSVVKRCQDLTSQVLYVNICEGSRAKLGSSFTRAVSRAELDTSLPLMCCLVTIWRRETREAGILEDGIHLSSSDLHRNRTI